MAHFFNTGGSMIANDKTSVAPGSGPLIFKGDKPVTQKDLDAFCKVVNGKAKEVCDGIVRELASKDIRASAIQSAGQWRIVVGRSSEHVAAEPELANIADLNITANITFTAAAADMPPIINALEAFFGNWHAVAGLVAVGAVYVVGQYVMQVARRP
jgi:hypothetical protein